MDNEKEKEIDFKPSNWLYIFYGHENEASNGENVDLLGKLLI